MRAGVTDLGMTMLPICRCQRMIAWAGVTPSSSAIFVIVASCRSFDWPSGLHASGVMERLANLARSSAWLKVGCIST